MIKKNNNRPLSLAVQLMVVEVISELLISTSPEKLGEVLTNHLRELSGAKTVTVLAHQPDQEFDEVLTVSPARRANLLSNADLRYFRFSEMAQDLPFLSDGLPSDHPLRLVLARAGIQSMCRYSLAVGGEEVGMLLLFDLPGIDRISETNQIIHLLIPSIALALKNALNYRHVERQALELDRRVKERTSELAKALFEAKSARQNVELILQSISDGLLFTDGRNHIELMSPSAEMMLGLGRKECIWRPAEEVLAGTPLLEQLLSISSGNKEQSRVEWLSESHGMGEKICQARSSLVKGPHGKTVGIITLIQDVTRERELDRMKSEFISTAAHELRTPLAAVMGFAEILKDPKLLDKEQKEECLDILYHNSERLEKIVDELFDVSRVESGQLIHVSPEPCDLVALIRQYTHSVNPTTPSHRFIEHCPDSAVHVFVDKAKLSRVMDNLLSNACKFSPSGSLIEICCRVQGDKALVTVSDEGIGMSPSQIEHVFDKFYRVDSSDTAKGGLGLGMGIVKGIVEAHDGKIWVESTLGTGTHVHFTLPLADTKG